MSTNIVSRERRKKRTRFSIRKKSSGKHRLSVHRTGRHIYAQVIDDSGSVTVASASSLEKNFPIGKSSTVSAAEAVGKLVASRAKDKGVTIVVFDRGSFLFHGRVKAVADGARSSGLVF